MAEYIERGAAIAELKKDVMGGLNYDHILKNIPPADVQPVKWISMTERLPESVCKSYLCLTDTGYHCEVRWTNNVYGLWKSDNIDRWGWSIADVPQYCKITHWMPLPKPPKDGET